MKIANLNNITASSGIAAADEKNTQTVTAEKKAASAPNRFDRYEGMSFIDGAVNLNDSSLERESGIFSENTGIEVGEKILAGYDSFKGYTGEGFSAKHIISVFFLAESNERYNCCVDYEDGAEKGWSNLNCIAPEVCNGRFNEDNVARIASSVGKYIDSLYEQGKYTDDEYAQLNAEIKNCSKHWLSKIVDARVGKRLRDEDAKIYGGKFYVKMPAKSREERYLEEIAMRKRVEAENPFDFDAFFKKIDQMRFNIVGVNSDSDKNA